MEVCPLNAFLKKISLLLLILAIAAGAVGLIPRFKEEMAKKDVALLVEYSDIDVMARQAGLSFDVPGSRSSMVATAAPAVGAGGGGSRPAGGRPVGDPGGARRVVG